MGLYLIAADTLLPYGSLWNLAQGLLGLGLVIFVHELGHFLVAKACGVKCEKFYIGFDPPMPLGLPSALWKYKWGETEYGLGVIPLGGYVKMLGQDDNPQNAAAEAERIRVAKENPDGDGDYEIDPRSYPAKTVPQRMAIISAGVIMNLIFAVIFAVVAYNLGVKYTPAMVGSTVPGDTAWKNGIQPGDSIVQFGKDGRRDEQFRFIDLRFQVIKVDVDEPMDVLIRHEDGSEDWKTLFPKERKKVNSGLATIGVRSASATRIADYEFAARSVVKRTDLEEGDVIKALRINSEQHEITNGFDIDRLLINHPAEEIEFLVDRFENPDDPSSTSSEVSVMVPPLPAWEFGLRMKLGPIDAVQLGSPAEAAGFKKGDLLTQVNGDPIVNPMAIDDMLMNHVGSEATVTVLRAGQSLDLKVTPREREMLGLSGRRGGAISTECLGVAFYLEDEIESVVPGSPADKVGLKPGDRLRSADFSIAKSASDKEKEKIKSLGLKKLDFTEFPRSWPELYELFQELPEHTGLRLTYERDGDLATVEMLPALSSSNFDPERGVVLEALSRVRTAATLGESVSLGLRETKEGIGQVFFTLKRIGKLKKHLGGPLTIGAAAMSEASQGWPRLFTFLTLLSANLAVVNFLPIPVLDGGHIMFLLYEGVVGKPMPERIAMTATMMGLVFILGLMAYVLGLDFFRFSGMGS